MAMSLIADRRQPVLIIVHTQDLAAFANPHLAGLDAARSDLLRAQHERLFAATKVVVLNMAMGSADGAAKRLLELCR